MDIPIWQMVLVGGGLGMICVLVGILAERAERGTTRRCQTFARENGNAMNENDDNIKCGQCCEFTGRNGETFFDGLCMKERRPRDICYSATLDDLAQRVGVDCYATADDKIAAMLLGCGWPKMLATNSCPEGKRRGEED